LAAKKDMGFSDKVDSLMNKTIAYLNHMALKLFEVEFPKGLNLGRCLLSGSAV